MANFRQEKAVYSHLEKVTKKELRDTHCANLIAHPPPLFS
jgi:hypothetical protein